MPAFPHSKTIAISPAALAIVAILVAVGGGYLLGHVSPTRGLVPTLALVIGVAGSIVMIADVRASLWATIGVIALLPFATIPFHLGLTLTLLEAASLITLATWFATIMLRRDQLLASGTQALLIILFVAETGFAFLIGVTNGYTMATFHDYGKFLLSLLLVFVVWNVATNLDDARRLISVLLIGAGSASVIGLALYAGGAGLTTRVLVHLIPYGYPSSKIVRYIEDSPAKSMRLTSTSVDPNSFGGLLAVIVVLACAMAIARHRSISRWISVPAFGFCGLAALLTYSRGAWVGIAAGLAVLALLRHRWLILPGVLAALPVAFLGLGANFVHRMYLGLTLQDPATKLRLREYQNALTIIKQHPIFGVGFGNAPSINEQTGVSSIYLTLGERVGLVGLALFLITVGSIAVVGLNRWRSEVESERGELILGHLAALASALTVGIFDHYFFNITFPHMTALFWVVCGLILALSAPVGSVSETHRTRSSLLRREAAALAPD
ncbi:MAG: O-antigen ligase family protein [Nitrolancea sp.]